MRSRWSGRIARGFMHRSFNVPIKYASLHDAFQPHTLRPVQRVLRDIQAHFYLGAYLTGATSILSMMLDKIG